jgi:glycosyltransferase involved in cell wall biosynthesis
MGTSVIVPCRNEAGSIEFLLESIVNSISSQDELIVIEGGSYDATWEVIKRFSTRNSQMKISQQEGKGKFDAVLKGIKMSESEYVMIWDADGTVSLSDNLRILNQTEEASFLLTGDRLRGSREAKAMQTANFFGNWFFGIIWGIFLRRTPFDTLCGTKKFPQDLLNNAPSWLVKNDPYGDFTILAMALINKIKVISTPVEYSARKYGKTNIHRWSGGFLLLRLVIRIAVRRR